MNNTLNSLYNEQQGMVLLIEDFCLDVHSSFRFLYLLVLYITTM